MAAGAPPAAACAVPLPAGTPAAAAAAAPAAAPASEEAAGEVGRCRTRASGEAPMGGRLPGPKPHEGGSRCCCRRHSPTCAGVANAKRVPSELRVGQAVWFTGRIGKKHSGERTSASWLVGKAAASCVSAAASWAEPQEQQMASRPAPGRVQRRRVDSTSSHGWAYNAPAVGSATAAHAHAPSHPPWLLRAHAFLSFCSSLTPQAEADATAAGPAAASAAAAWACRFLSRRRAPLL